MEFTAAGADDLESLGRLRGFRAGPRRRRRDPRRPGSRADYRRPRRGALRRIDKQRITLNPDCGFAPGSAAKVDTDEVYLKLKAEAEAARCRASDTAEA